MAKEALYVPEEHLVEVIQVIRNGLKSTKGISRETRAQLKKWCDEEEDYLNETDDDE